VKQESRGKLSSWLINALIIAASCAVVLFAIRWKQTSQNTIAAPVDGLPAVKVQILNGCGEAGLAQKLRDYLMKFQVDIRESENAGYVMSETVVLDRINQRPKAVKIAQLLNIPLDHVIRQDNKTLVDIDVTVIIGKDYKKYFTFLTQEERP
jgi:hypothetical protein